MDNQKKIIEEIADNLALPLTDLELNADLKNDLGLSPIEIADLFESLAEKFNITFDRGEIEQILAVKDLVELIEDKLLE